MYMIIQHESTRYYANTAYELHEIPTTRNKQSPGLYLNLNAWPSRRGTSRPAHCQTTSLTRRLTHNLRFRSPHIALPHLISPVLTSLQSNSSLRELTAPPRNSRHRAAYHRITCRSLMFLPHTTHQQSSIPLPPGSFGMMDEDSTHRGKPVTERCRNFPMNICTSANHVLSPIIPCTIASGSNNLYPLQHPHHTTRTGRQEGEV